MFFDECLQCDNLAFAGHRARLDLYRNHIMTGPEDQIDFDLVLCAIVIVLDRFDPVFKIPDQLFADKCFPDTTKLIHVGEATLAAATLTLLLLFQFSTMAFSYTPISYKIELVL